MFIRTTRPLPAALLAAALTTMGLSVGETNARADDSGTTTGNPVVLSGIQISGGSVTIYRTSRPFGSATTIEGPSGVNFAECSSDAAIGLPLSLVSGQTMAGWDTLEVFVNTDGVGCGDTNRRQTADGTTPACSRVASFDVTGGINRVLYVPIYALIDAAENQRSAPESAVTAYNFFDASTNATTPVVPSSVDGGTPYPSPDVSCLVSNATTMDPTAFYVDILAFNGESVRPDPTTGVATAERAYQTDNTISGDGTVPYIEYMVGSTFDLLGPAPLSGVTTGVGDSLIVANWTAPDPTPDDLVDYQAYCYASGSVTTGTDDAAVKNYPTDGSVDAGTETTDDADTDETSTADADAAIETVDSAATDDSGDETSDATATVTNTCPNYVPTAFTANTLPTSALDPYKCGDGSGSSASLQLDGLQNNVDYAIFIAGVDRYGNAGLLSNEACGMPITTVDFYDTYRDDGGKAGGGYCELGRHPASVAGMSGLAFVALVIASRRARRRR